MSLNRKKAVIQAIKHKQTQFCPYTFLWDPRSDIAERLDAHYGSPDWRSRYKNYITTCGVIEDGRKVQEEGPPLRTDHFGSVWRADRRPIHLERPVLQKPSLKGYTFPDIEVFIEIIITENV